MLPTPEDGYPVSLPESKHHPTSVGDLKSPTDISFADVKQLPNS